MLCDCVRAGLVDCNEFMDFCYVWLTSGCFHFSLWLLDSVNFLLLLDGTLSCAKVLEEFRALEMHSLLGLNPVQHAAEIHEHSVVTFWKEGLLLKGVCVVLCIAVGMCVCACTAKIKRPSCVKL